MNAIGKGELCSLPTVFAAVLGFALLVSSTGASGRDKEENKCSGCDRIALLTWEEPTSNTNGKLLDDLAGYVIYSGTESGRYSRAVKVPLDSHDLCCKTVSEGKAHGRVRTECRYVVLELGVETHYFAVKAYNEAGTESEFSNEVRK
jgi:hypothetical protein